MIFLDFETYYDKDYSLTKLPTMQYVRDARFKCLGCAIWQPGMVKPGFFPPETLPDLFSRLDWSSAVAHNASFDAAVLWHHYNISPGKWYDTNLMLRYAISQGHYPPDTRTGLKHHGDKGDTLQAIQQGGERLAEYAVQDVLIMMRLFKRLHPLIPQMELSLIDLHIRMAAEPVLTLDRNILTEVATAKKPPLAIALRKNANFIKALDAFNVTPGTKISPRTGKKTYAFAKTDSFMQRLASHSDPKVRLLHKLRTEAGSNINQTRAQRFLDVGDPFPVPLLYYGAHTGRASGQDKMNAQNLPRGGTLRRALCAPPSHKLVRADLSQIEVRVLAWLAQDKNLLDVFYRGSDPYIAFAAEVMARKPETDITKEERRLAKPPVLACGFGQGANGLRAYAAGMGIILSDTQAAHAVNGYRQKYNRVPVYWRELERKVQQDQELVLPSGRKLTYPDMFRRGRDLFYTRHSIFSKQRKGQRDIKKIWHGLLVENVVQATARDVVMWQTLQLTNKYKVVLSVHDEAILCVPEQQAEEALADILKAFSTTPPWASGLPVQGDGGIYKNYAKEV